MAKTIGTTLKVAFGRVVDGDTLRVSLPGQAKDESLRLLALDTEESFGMGDKPVTPWGKEAKKRAALFFQGAQEVTLEFPGNEDASTCVQKYRDNFGRLLVSVYLGDVDFQETMIEEGYSPYFVKYGNAVFAGHHRRYQEAERRAQRQKIGVWDQPTVNGSEMRNYAALGTWWKLRATLIDDYRRLKAQDPSLLDSRLDYPILVAKAGTGARATVFTELRSLARVGGRSGVVSLGSVPQPFNLFIPDLDGPEGSAIVHLLQARYVGGDENHPRQSYAYVTGALSTFQNKPQMVLASADQITDGLPNDRQDTASPNIRIVALLPDPLGEDRGKERITLRNAGLAEVKLQGWFLQDLGNHRMPLAAEILNAGQEKEMPLLPGPLSLNNSGDTVLLLDPDGKVRHQVTYSGSDVKSGQPIRFS